MQQAILRTFYDSMQVAASALHGRIGIIAAALHGIAWLIIATLDHTAIPIHWLIHVNPTLKVSPDLVSNFQWDFHKGELHPHWYL